MDKTQLKDNIKQFLAEDISVGDHTSKALFPPDRVGEAVFVAKDFFMVAGMESVAVSVFRTVNPAIEFPALAEDATPASPGDILLRVRGPVLDLFCAERVALNLVQRLSGIATLTYRFVEKVKHLPVQIVDTRKTTPGMRILEKYAVRVGGGSNHRFNLSDGLLIKDNHIAAYGGISEAVQRVRQNCPHILKIEVEIETLDQVEECLSCGVDIIMLDNMTVSAMRKAVQKIEGRALVEASGGINLKNVRDIAETGVDFISVGALTHSAPACDISMKYLDVKKKIKKPGGKKLSKRSL